MNEEVRLSVAEEFSVAIDPAVQAPPLPETLEDTGLSASFAYDLILKTLYRAGARTGTQLVERTRLRFGILDDLLLDLQQRHLLEVRRSDGHGRYGYTFDLTREGRERARERLLQSQYVGPAPVPFETYVEWVLRQSVRDREITPERMRGVIDHLVLGDEFIDAVGAAANSGTALFLYGSPGNGKTVLARALARLYDDAIYLPEAVSVEGGTIIQLYDPVFHRPAEPDGDSSGSDSILRETPGHDPRFVRVLRPAVTVGGELEMSQLELLHDEPSGVYRAPLQLKANGGVFILDDFGRQRIPSRDLLNRWMVPLEERLDYLALPTGHKLPVPFDCFLVFSTNLSPTSLVEEAFLRRLRYKIAAEDPTREQYQTIFRRCCEDRGLEYSEDIVDQVYDRYYASGTIAPRACHPRDLVAHVCDEAAYRGQAPVLTRETMEQACRTYFLELTPESDSSEPATRSA